MRIWIMAAGCYSDYRVLGIVDDEHKAEAERVAGLCGAYVEDAPLELNAMFDAKDPGQDAYRVSMLKDGSIRVYGINKETARLQQDGTRHEEHWYVQEEGWIDTRSYKRGWVLHVSVYARDENHAVKITNETRVAILAGQKPSRGDFPRQMLCPRPSDPQDVADLES